MKKVIRIGTRDSQLALWQANHVQEKLQTLGYETELVKVKSEGDLVLDKPLYELGITGIFTKTLDIAMLNGTVDIAVHSMKDVPTALPKGIVQAAVLERASGNDILVHKTVFDFDQDCVIATGSLRRKAQWLHRYPHHEVVGLRGNVNTRLKKLEENNWTGAIFAEAGLDRINNLPKEHLVLDWMIPAPAQGAMMVVALEGDQYSIDAASKLNHFDTQICTEIERSFLRELEGGCTAPIGAWATIEGEELNFSGCLLSIDGLDKVEIEHQVVLRENDSTGARKCKGLIAHEAGQRLGRKLLEKGGKEIMLALQRNRHP